MMAPTAAPQRGNPPPIRPNATIPLELLAREVYDEASPAVQLRMRAMLLGKVFESASPETRYRLVTSLMRPLGLLTVMAIANGVFAPLRLRGSVGLGDAQLWLDMRSSDVVELALQAQQAQPDILTPLAPLLSTPGLLAASAAAVLLAQILGRQAPPHRAN